MCYISENGPPVRIFRPCMTDREESIRTGCPPPAIYDKDGMDDQNL